MATFTSITPPSVGDDLPATTIDQLGQNDLFLLQHPYLAAYNSVAVAGIANNTLAQVTLGGLTTSGYGFSVSSNNAIAPITGIYSISFAVTTTTIGTANDSIIASVQVNGGQVIAGAGVPSYSFIATSTGSGIAACTAGDQISLQIYNSSGNSIDTIPSASGCFLHVFYVGAQ